MGAGGRRAIAPMIAALILLLALMGIGVAVLAIFKPELLTMMLFGLGVVAILVLVFALPPLLGRRRR